MSSTAVNTFYNNLLTEIVNPFIYLLLALAVVYFLWGTLKFIGAAGDDKAYEEGKRHMLWGVIGIFIMVGVWGFIALIKNTFGI